MKKAKSFKPDICVFDYNLPVKNGVEIAKDMKDAGVTAKFVLMTASMEKDVVDRAKEVGFSATIEKPINLKKIKEALA